MVLFEAAPNRRLLAGQLVWFGVWAATTIIALALHPSLDGHGTHTQLGLPPCPSALLFDRPCPGCGLTTSWTAFVHGDFALAFQAHPLGPLLYLGFTVTALLALRGFVTGRRLIADSPMATRLLIAVALSFFAFGLVRMALVPHYRASVDLTAKM